MRIYLPYGKKQVECDIDNDRILQIVTPSETDPAPDQQFEVEKALKTPIDGPTIEELSPRGKVIAIAVDDITRETPTHILLPPLLQQLEIAGAKKSDIKIITALGTHRPMTKDEMKEKYGSEILEEYEVVNHAFNDPSQLEYCGTIAEDIPVWINKEYLKADIRITTGNIVPHFNAGWGAGAKILLPGLAGEETVGRMHVHSGITTPNCLGIEENPTRKIINAFAEKVGIHLLVNTVLTLKREVIQVFAGHFVKAHQQGVRFAKCIYGVPLSELADITICSSYPANIEFWQGAKGLSASDLATKNGGGIILLTPCPEGLAVMHPLWSDYLHHTHEELKAIYKKGAVEDFIALGIALSVTYVRDRHKICIISDGISDQDAEKIRFQKAKATEEALNFLSKQYGEKSKINIITHGGETYPTLTK